MQLEEYRRRWLEKHALRAIYTDLHRRMIDAAVPGLSLEIGGGIGNLDTGSGDLVRMDIQLSPGLDVAADAHRLPFRAGVFSNLYLFDVLHHLQCPLMFFAEAERVLRRQGRVILVEPGITPVSWLMYRLGHEEPVEMTWEPDRPCVLDRDKDPYASNQATPTILFRRPSRVFERAMPSLRIVDARWMSLFAYPLSGGFKPWSLIPARWVETVLRLEDGLLPWLGPLMAFRLMVVLEKK